MGLCFPTVIALLATLLPLGCFAQMDYPLRGQESNSAPLVTDLSGNVVKIDVTTSALLDRIINFNTKDSTYEAVWWVVLTWQDPSAGELVAASTASVLSGADACGRPCDSSGMPSAGCCDRIWMPHLELPNMVKYDQDQLPRYRINANASSGTVTWSTRLVGTWYTPLDFRAYPFDHQHLLLELAIADSQAGVAGLRWEHVAKLNNTAHTKGADLSGWRVKWGKAKVYDSRTCMAQYGVAVPSYTSALGDTGALQPALYNSLRIGDRYYANNAGRGTTSPQGCGSYATVYDEGRALYGPVVLVADIMVKRVASYYILTNLLPVLIISLVTFVVYYMPCNALSDRMAVEMTLFLSLTAMQFVFDFPPSNYINALQQVVLVSYCMVLLACLESLLVNFVATLPQALSNKRTCFKKYNTLLRRTSNFFTRSFFASKSGKSAAQAAAALAQHHAALLAGADGQPPHPMARKDAPAIRGGGAASDHPSGARGYIRVGSGKRTSMRRTATMTAAANFAAPRCTTLTRAAARAAEAAVVAAAAGEAPALPYGEMPSLPPPAASASASGRSEMSTGISGTASPGSVHISVHSHPHSHPHPHHATPPCAPTPDPAAPPASHHLPNRHLPAFDLQCASSSCNGSAGGAAPGLGLGPGAGGPLGRRRVGGRARRLAAQLRGWLGSVVRAPRRFYQHCKEDPEFAWFVARRIDKLFCVVSFAMFCVVISVLLWVQTMVGDHKLMLGDAPGNM